MKKKLLILIFLMMIFYIKMDLNASRIVCQYNYNTITGKDYVFKYVYQYGEQLVISGESPKNWTISHSITKSNFIQADKTVFCPTVCAVQTVEDKQRYSLKISAGECASDIYKVHKELEGEVLEKDQNDDEKEEPGTANVVCKYGGTTGVNGIIQNQLILTYVDNKVIGSGCPSGYTVTVSGFEDKLDLFKDKNCPKICMQKIQKQGVKKCTATPCNNSCNCISAGEAYDPDIDEPIPGGDGDLDINVGTGKTCEEIIGDNGKALLKIFIVTMRIIAPLLLILMTSIEFMKVVPNQDEEGIMKAWKTAGLRAIIVVIIMLLPTFLNIIGKLVGIFDGCGIW